MTNSAVGSIYWSYATLVAVTRSARFSFMSHVQSAYTSVWLRQHNRIQLLVGVTGGFFAG
jgi:hypothetical protein